MILRLRPTFQRLYLHKRWRHITTALFSPDVGSHDTGQHQLAIDTKGMVHLTSSCGKDVMKIGSVVIKNAVTRKEGFTLCLDSYSLLL